MEPMQHNAPVIEYDELIDMRTHLTVAVLAAAHLRRALKDVPNATRFDGYLDQALNNLVEDVRKVDGLMAQTRAQALAPVPEAASAHGTKMKKPRLLTRVIRAPFCLIRQVGALCWRQVQQRVLTRPMAFSGYR